MSQFIIIAVDGPSASGKGTLARRLADQFHLFYLDTGSVYRAAAKRILDQGKNPDDPEAGASAAAAIRDIMTADLLNDPELRTDIVADATSRSSRFPAVRGILTELQRHLANHPPLRPQQRPYHGSILDGRDIGTVVCPNAHVKLYVVADIETRAQRRFKELSERGIETNFQTVFQDMMDRDARDSGRETAPLKPAKDAIILDTTILSPDEAFDKAVEIIRERIS